MKIISVRLRGQGELEKFTQWAESNGGQVIPGAGSVSYRGVYAKARVDDTANIEEAHLNVLSEVVSNEEAVKSPQKYPEKEYPGEISPGYFVVEITIIYPLRNLRSGFRDKTHKSQKVT